MDVSIVIVNYNTRELLLDCLRSIHATLPPLSFEVFVVDNASSDGSVAAVNETFPDVDCTQNDRNLGFARANNIGLRKATGRYLVLLNTDAMLTPAALATIVSYMDHHPDIAICGGQLLNADGSLQNSIANVPTLATELLNKSVLRRLFPQKYPGKEQRFTGPTAVETIIGACMVVSRSAMEQVGLLDEAYFFFFEETDWCLSMRRSGLRVMFHPEARIFHLQGQTAKKFSSAARIEYWRSRYTFFRKHYAATTLSLLRVGLLVKLCGSLLLQLLAAPFSGRNRQRFKVSRDLLLWHVNGCPDAWGLDPAAGAGRSR